MFSNDPLSSWAGGTGHCFPVLSAGVEAGESVQQDVIPYQCVPAAELWVVSMYWATATITSIGYGDVTAANVAEQVTSLLSLQLTAHRSPLTSQTCHSQLNTLLSLLPTAHCSLHTSQIRHS